MGSTDLATLYGRMYFIRRFEETLLDLFAQGKLVGTTHTYIGQEANAVGIIDHLEPERDVIFSNHRCHGHYLAFTDDAFGLLSEVMGKATGTCGGKGGSQHLCRGNFYSNGVLGSIVPVATGIALAEKKKGTGAVSTVFLGDGTLGEGVTYESLNMASLWQLPVLFVVENNHYAQSTPVELELAGSIAARGARPSASRSASWTRPTWPRCTRRRDERSPASARPASPSFSCSTPIASAPTRRATTTASPRRSRSAASATRSASPASGWTPRSARRSSRRRSSDWPETVEAAEAAPAAAAEAA